MREIDVTTTLIVCGAIASRDFYPGHHDRDAAVRAGSPDVFMNIMTTAGLVSSYLTDWAGPRAVLHEIDLRLGAPNYPGDVMRLTGDVVESVAGETGTAVTVRFEGRNSRGAHARGTARLEIRQ
ncbi:MaoC/PaaZ C-terminal domain-containing protein [Phytohabitans kaempferiae]|uniref:MaoC/PaaZ C-terminal domain-containing protein n=1 Tax=Phytohabitans kaempferiae TaxID=1620943 RepID=A0ABV6M730_9ACTN